MSEWIGIDLDGTLAEYYPSPDWDGSIGPPIPRMVERVKAWLLEGREVRIVTARVAPYAFPDPRVNDPRSIDWQRGLVNAWCMRHLGAILPVTCSKDYGMTVLYDDRAVQVITNIGEVVDVVRALAKYVRHDQDCRLIPCTCGLSAALVNL